MRRASLRSLLKDASRGAVPDAHGVGSTAAANRNARERSIGRRPVAAALLLSLTVVLCAIFGTVAASADLISPPSVENESASHISSADATLEAQISPNGFKTTYQFRLESGCLWPRECAVIKVYPLPSGELPASSDVDSVSLDLNSAGVTLQPNTEYAYSVEATNSAGTTKGPEQRFTTPATPEAPVIASESASHITATDATLEAAIEPHAWEGAYYQFQLVKDPGEYAPEILCPPPPWPGYSGCIGTRSEGALPIGWVCGKCENLSPARPVQLDLASAGVTLEPATTYHYRVIAARAVKTEDTIQWEPPIVYGADQTFSTPSSSVTQPTTSGSDPSSSILSGEPSQPAVIPPALGPLPGNKTQVPTNAQKLSRALKACVAKKSKAKRAACRKWAHKKFGTIAAEKSKKR